LKSVVCVKQVYDVASNFSVNQGKIVWGDSPQVINPWDEFAVEAALLQKEAAGGEVISLSLGDASAREALKHALAMGCDSAILVETSGAENLDSQAVASLLAAAIRKIGDVDVVYFGRQASDTEMGVLAVLTARKLGWPILTLISAITGVDEARKSLSAERSMEEGRQSVSTRLPAVVSVNKDIGEPRFPSFLGTRKAAKANIPVWAISDLGSVKPEVVVKDLGVEYTSQRTTTLEMIEGATPEEIANKLVDRLVEEKII